MEPKKYFSKGDLVELRPQGSVESAKALKLLLGFRSFRDFESYVIAPMSFGLSRRVSFKLLEERNLAVVLESQRSCYIDGRYLTTVKVLYKDTPAWVMVQYVRKVIM